MPLVDRLVGDHVLINATEFTLGEFRGGFLYPR